MRLRRRAAAPVLSSPSVSIRWRRFTRAKMPTRSL